MMDDGNYLNISATFRDKFVYRFVSIERLLQLFENRQNVLVKPRLWDDPFENFILRSQVRLPIGKLATFGYHDQFYGQCWTLHKSSDAMWRIYSPVTGAVRIRSTVRRLAEGLGQSLGDKADAEAFIGRVQYLSSRRLIAYAKNVLRGDRIQSTRTFAETLLVKRLAFKHEREVRLLRFQSCQDLVRDDVFAYSVDPHAFVGQIMIDPRLSKKDASNLMAKIIAKTGYRGEMKRSLLYATPPKMLFSFEEDPDLQSGSQSGIEGTQEKVK